MAGSDGYEIGQQAQAESAEAAAHEVGRIGVEQWTPIDDRELRMNAGRRGPEHQLPLMLAAGHQAQGLRVVLVVVDGDRQRRQFAPFEQVEAGLGEAAQEPGVIDHQAIHVDRREAQVLAEDVQAERVVGVDVDLPNLAVPAARTQGLQTQREVTAGEGIQHHVDAFAAVASINSSYQFSLCESNAALAPSSRSRSRLASLPAVA